MRNPIGVPREPRVLRALAITFLTGAFAISTVSTAVAATPLVRDRGTTVHLSDRAAQGGWRSSPQAPRASAPIQSVSVSVDVQHIMAQDGSGNLYALSYTRVGFWILDPTGVVAPTLIDDPNVIELAIGGSRLYASVFDSTSAGIDIFDLGSGSPVFVKHVTVAGPSSLRNLVWAGSHLFFTTSGTSPDTVEAMSALGKTITDVTPAALGSPPWIDLGHVPGSSKVILSTPSLVATYASTVPLSGGNVATFPGTLSGGQGTQVEGDGAHLFVNDSEYRLSDLVQTGTYSDPIPNRGVFFAASASSSRFAVGGISSEGEPSIALFDQGTWTPAATYRMGATDSMMFSTDGSLLYVLTYVLIGGSPTYELLSIDPAVSDTAISLASSADVIEYGNRVTLTAHLIGGGSGGVANIWGKVEGSPSALLGSGPVDANGLFSVRVRPPANAGFWATFTATDMWNASMSDGANVSVREVAKGKALKAYAHKNGVAYYHHSQNIYVVAWALPSTPKLPIDVGVQVKKGSRWAGRISSHAFTCNHDGYVVVYVPSGYLSNGAYRWVITSRGGKHTVESLPTYVRFHVAS